MLLSATTLEEERNVFSIIGKSKILSTFLVCICIHHTQPPQLCAVIGIFIHTFPYLSISYIPFIGPIPVFAYLFLDNVFVCKCTFFFIPPKHIFACLVTCLFYIFFLAYICIVPYIPIFAFLFLHAPLYTLHTFFCIPLPY
jgi:hypothetical protein